MELKVGDIVYLKKYKAMLGEVKELNGEKVTLSLCENEMEVTVAVSEVGLTGGIQPHREVNTQVTILGTPYKIVVLSEEDYQYNRDVDGWCDAFAKEILIFNYKQDAESVKDLVGYQKKVLRHEIVHAFLYESGLWQNAYGSKCWARNEEMVDWLAIQIPKIYEAYKEAGCE